MAKKGKYEQGKSKMIFEDKSAVANLPQNVIMKKYPSFKYGLDPQLDDSISGIDEQMYDDMSEMHKNLGTEKY